MIRNITITPALNGYIVQVGCKTIVFSSKNQLLLDLKSYLDDPRLVERNYLRDAINNEDPKDCAVPAPPEDRIRSLGSVVEERNRR